MKIRLHRELQGAAIGFILGVITVSAIISKTSPRIDTEIALSDIFDSFTTIVVALTLGYFLKGREDRSRVQARIFAKNSQEIIDGLQKVRSGYSTSIAEDNEQAQYDIIREFKNSMMAANRCHDLLKSFNRDTESICELINDMDSFRDTITDSDRLGSGFTDSDIASFDSTYDRLLRRYNMLIVDVESTIV